MIVGVRGGRDEREDENIKRETDNDGIRVKKPN